MTYLAQKELHDWEDNSRENLRRMANLESSKTDRNASLDGFHIELHELSIHLRNVYMLGVGYHNNTHFLSVHIFQGGMHDIPRCSHHAFTLIFGRIQLGWIDIDMHYAQQYPWLELAEQSRRLTQFRHP